MVERESSKLATAVRFRSPAPNLGGSYNGSALGFDPRDVGSIPSPPAKFAAFG